MISQDNRLMPLSPSPSETLDRPLRDLTHPVAQPSQLVEAKHLRDYLSIVLKRKWLILSLVVVVTSLVAIHMYRQPSIYEANAQLQIEHKSRSVLQTQGFVIQGPRDPVYWNTQLKLLQDPTLVRQVILTLDLQNNQNFLGGQARGSLLSNVRRLFGGAKAEKKQSEEGGVPVVSEEASAALGNSLTPEQLERLEPFENALLANLTVEPVEKTNLVQIRFRHTDPEVASKVANMLALVFRQNDIARETKGETTAREQLDNEIAKLQIKIQQLEEMRTNRMKSIGVPLLPGQEGVNITQERVKVYSDQLLQAEKVRKEIEARYQAATSMKDKWAIPEVQANKDVQRLREKIENLEENKRALLVRYKPEWPDVQKVQAQIEKTKEQLDKYPDEILTGLRLQMEAAQKNEQMLSRDYRGERGEAIQQGEAQIDMNGLNQELETTRQFYNTLFQRQKELQITSSDRSNNVSITTPARTPRQPIGPQRGRNIVVALLLSLGAGIGLAFLLDYLDDTLKSVEDVDRNIQLPTLALIPAPRVERGLLARARSRGEAPDIEAPETTALALIEDARSPVAEAYRHLRTSLLLSSAGQAPRTVLVTSSQPSEGKTTTAVNIAMMLAQTGVEVLILDCDLRRPRIHTHFGVPNARGVTNYLSGEAQVAELIQTVEAQPNLKVITSGPVPPNAAELLGSDEMRKLLYVLGENFQHIIIDSPPAISFTDASILSTLVDGVMLVVHGGRSSRNVVRRAKQQLLDVGAHIFGIVLNNVKLESNDYYYYSNYYNSSYYSDDEPEGDAAKADGR
ncbi:MAG TPA: polysaccharide biosynthesis tyrosine autokinase [Pyrinomonadaceae bacterium]|nr:polysaccharide biosynthesis tyrosine autokinase [Pyrinomonadaceae bacterium]